MILVILIFLVVLTMVFFLFMKQKQFGKDPFGERLQRVRQSSNYRDGAFQNPMPTDMMLKDTSYSKLIWASFNKPSSVRPPQPLPSIKTGLKNLADEKPVIVWFGHSSYLIKSKGFTILVDPVLNGNASPVSFFGKNHLPDRIFILYLISLQSTWFSLRMITTITCIMIPLKSLQGQRNIFARH